MSTLVQIHSDSNRETQGGVRWRNGRECIPPKPLHRRGHPLPGSCAHTLEASPSWRQIKSRSATPSPPNLPQASQGPCPLPIPSQPQHLAPSPRASQTVGVPSPHCTSEKLRQEPLSEAPRAAGRSFCLLLHPGLRATRDPQGAVTVTLSRRTQRSSQLSSPLKSGFKLDFTVTSPQVTGCSGCCFN